MIPEYNSEGTLPAGIYDASLEEIKKRFVYNVKRENLFTHLLKLIKDIKAIGCKTIYIDGSFITNKQLPGDMDICWENTGIDLDVVKALMPILFKMNHPRNEQQNEYCADLFPAHFIESNSKKYFIDFFRRDNTGNPKGIIKLNI